MDIKTSIKGFFSAKKTPPEKDEIVRVGTVDDPVWRDEVIAFVKEEWERRREERREFELQWQLNTNFLLGNQYSDINTDTNEVVEQRREKDYMERLIFNHIAPIVETRLAKLARVRPAQSVRPASSDLSDVSTAKVCTKILESVAQKLDMPRVVASATSWAEITGTVLYKTAWDFSAGRIIGISGDEQIFEGDISYPVIPPYEFFPDSNYSADIEHCRSVMHARAYHVDDIDEIWGVQLPGSDVDVFGLSNTSVGLGGLGYSASVPKVTKTTKQDSEIVLEYYERPSKRYKDGRFIIVAGDELLYYGTLPYKIGEDGRRDFPFVRQICIESPGCFWGISIIERCIPIQRAYNAVKNRKQEFLNRIALGILNVDENSYDLEDLEENGLAPGTVLVMKAGGQPAKYLEIQQIPPSFAQEEQNLMDEFILISGVSEISRNSNAPTGVGSGVALSILTEQDDTRLSLTADFIRNAILSLGKITLRLYKQFAVGIRMDRLVGENNEVIKMQWMKSDITSDDVVLDTENELTQSPAQRKQMVMDFLQAGLFNNPETGVIDKKMRTKVFRMMQMGDWENANDIEELQISKAQRENMMLMDGEQPMLKEIDDDELHIIEHKAFMLGGDFEKIAFEQPELAAGMDFHVKQHEKARDIKANLDMTKQQMMQHGYVPD